MLASNDQAAQEITYEVSGTSAEFAVGGVRMNVVPMEGGNTFRGTFLTAFTPGALAASNLDDELRARGVLSVNELSEAWDFSPTFGGPIVRDRLWFYSAYRNWGSHGYYANIFYDSDPTRQAENPNELWDANMRLTYQVSARNKVSFYYDWQGRSQPFRFVSGIQSPEAGAATYYPTMYVAQSRWTSPDYQPPALRGRLVVLPRELHPDEQSRLARSGDVARVRDHDGPVHPRGARRGRDAESQYRQRLEIHAGAGQPHSRHGLPFHEDRPLELLR